MADEKVVVRLELSRSDLNDITRKSSVAFDKAGKNAGQAFGSSFGISAASAIKAGTIAVAAATVGLALFTKKAVSAAANIEDISVGFETLLGSASEAARVIEDLQKFTASTPFRLDSVAAAAQQLLAFGFASDTVIERLRAIGDVAAGSNSDLKEVALIFGQVRAAGKLTGERLLQFQERAIPIGPAIAESLGVAESAVKDLVSKGVVDFATFEEAFKSLSQEGGLFFEGTIRKSRTLTGVISTLGDNFDLAAADIGKSFLPLVKEVAIELTGLLQTVSDNKKEIAEYVSGGLDIALTVLGSTIAAVDILGRSFTILSNVIQIAGKSIINGILAPLAIFETSINTLITAVPILRKSLGSIGTSFTDSYVSMSDAINQDIAQIASAEAGDTGLGLLSSKIAEVQFKLQQLRDQNAATGNPLVPTPEEAAIAETFSLSMGEILDKANLLSSFETGFMGEGLVKAKTDAEKLAVAVGSLQAATVTFGKTAKMALANGLGQGFAAVGRALVNGENALKAFFAAFIGQIGNAMIASGTRWILEGIALSFISPGTGGGLIAAGSALAVAGGALSAVSAGLSKPSTSGAGAGELGTASATSTIVDDDIAGEQEERQQRVTVNIQGDVLDSEETGLRIVDIINRSVDDNSVQIRQQAFA